MTELFKSKSSERLGSFGIYAQKWEQVLVLLEKKATIDASGTSIDILEHEDK